VLSSFFGGSSTAVDCGSARRLGGQEEPGGDEGFEVVQYGGEAHRRRLGADDYVIGGLSVDKAQLNWETASIFFALTCITTIGYGTFVPETYEGKRAVIWYSIVGLVLFALAAAPLIDVLQRSVVKVTLVVEKICRGCQEAFGCIRPAEAKAAQEAPSPLLLLLVASWLQYSWIIFMGALLAEIEGWRPLDAQYWAFITSTSIGFGDFAPDTSMKTRPVFTYSAMLSGLVVMATYLSILSDVVMGEARHVFRWVEAQVAKRERVKRRARHAVRRAAARAERRAFRSGSSGGRTDLQPAGQLSRNFETVIAPGRGHALMRSAKRCASVGGRRLMIVVFAWALLLSLLLLGAWHIGHLERAAEREAVEATWADYQEARKLFAGADRQAVAMQEVMRTLEAMGTCSFPDSGTVAASNWDLYPAALYLFTAASSVGYGAWNVQTDEGKVFMMFFCVLLLWAFGSAIGLLVEGVRPILVGIPLHVIQFMGQRSCCRRNKSGPRHGGGGGNEDEGKMEVRPPTFHLIYMATILSVTVVFVYFASWFFQQQNQEEGLEWSLFDGLWFMFVTCTTIGFGDAVPCSGDACTAGVVWQMAVLVGGLVLVGMLQGDAVDALDGGGTDSWDAAEEIEKKAEAKDEKDLIAAEDRAERDEWSEDEESGSESDGSEAVVPRSDSSIDLTLFGPPCAIAPPSLSGKRRDSGRIVVPVDVGTVGVFGSKAAAAGVAASTAIASGRRDSDEITFTPRGPSGLGSSDGIMFIEDEVTVVTCL
jgi:hypothetical protein